MFFVRQNGSESGDVMVVYKVHQMLAAVNAPWVRTVLAVQRMCNLEHIHRIKTGVYALVAFVVGAAVQHFVIDDLIVVPEENLSDQGKVRF